MLLIKWIIFIGDMLQGLYHNYGTIYLYLFVVLIIAIFLSILFLWSSNLKLEIIKTESQKIADEMEIIEM